MVLSVVNQDSGMAPDDPLMRTLPFMMYIMFYVSPKEGATRESIRRGMEMWSYSMNNVTEEAAERGLRISQLPKIIEARKQMIKLAMSPNHPSYKNLRK